MGKEKITEHGLLHDTTNYSALIEAQAKTPSFLDSPKEYVSKAKKNYTKKDNVKKLKLTYSEHKSRDGLK